MFLWTVTENHCKKVSLEKNHNWRSTGNLIFRKIPNPPKKTLKNGLNPHTYM